MMEPIAPGTEDEPLITFSSSTKQEKERERLLSVRGILPNGRYGNVFEFKYLNGAEHWYCNACACPVMGFVFHHETGKRHKMALGDVSSQDRFPTPAEMDEPALQIAPGEPVPPGFEGQVEKVALIQERLDVFHAGPLVALEYLLELRDYDPSKEPNYLCILCDKKGDPRTVLTHLASFKHILQYLQKHFPTCYRALAPYMTKQYKRNWQTALHEIAEAIEKKFGRLKPMPVDADSFEKDQMHYLGLIAKGRHFSELSGYTFEELVNKDELTKVHEDDGVHQIVNPALLSAQKKKSPSPPVVANPIKKIVRSSNPPPAAAVGSRRRSLSSVSSVSSSEMSDFDEPKNKRPARGRSPPRRRSRSPLTRRYEKTRRSPPRRPDYRKDERDRNLMPWERSNYRKTKTDNASDNANKVKSDKMDEFKKLCNAIDNDMERILKQHKKNPEKHLQYNDEWKKFWNKRYKELQAEGKDVSKHDFKPEWIEYWNQRMVELHQEEVKSRKEALKKRLGLLEDPSPISFRIGGKRKSESQRNSPPSTKPIPPSALPDHDPEVIVIEDKDDESKSSRRSHSPWEDEPASKGNARPSREKSRNDRDPKKSKSKDESPKEKPQRHSRERIVRSPRNFSPKNRLDRSPKERLPSRSPIRHRLPDRSPIRDRHLDRSPIRDRHLDRSPIRDRNSRDRNSRDRNSRDRSPRDRRDSRERSWERDYKKKSWEHRDYRPRERIRVVSELPWEREKYREYTDYYKPPSVMRDVTRAPVLPPSSIAEEMDDGEINVVAVLRLLTALEEKLGSLGPKIIDLLAQALAMEKNEANSSENLLDNDINSVLFETVKEKLKGQLLAGLVEPIQEKAFKNAIRKTASLVHAASERNREKERHQLKVNPMKVPGVGTVDKAAIARQIANALVMQGKTDVTQAELEQLTNAVVGMAEASRKSNKPMTTANFLEQLTKTDPLKEKCPTPPKAIVVVPEPEPPVITVEKPTASNMEGLSDSDLQTLLQNFKDLSTEEQHGLINYLKKLETHEPERVERLRKFVNLGPSKSDAGEKKKETAPPASSSSGRESPFSNRVSSVNPASDERDKELDSREVKVESKKVEEEQTKVSFDSDEEDYSFEDVAKAASKNVKEKELEKERELVEESMKIGALKEKKDKEEFNLNETKALISNIMSSINKPDPSKGSLLGLGIDPSNLAVSSAEFAKTLNSLPVNIASLASIVGTVQSLTNSRSSIITPVTPVSAPRPTFESPPKPDFGGFGGRQQAAPVQDPNRPAVSYPQIRPNFNPEPSKPNPGPSGYTGGQSFYQQQRQNVTYPLDKPKVSYPNYFDLGGNDQGSDRFMGGNHPSRMMGGNMGMEQRGRPNDLGMEQRGRPNDLGMEQRGRLNDLGVEQRGRPNDLGMEQRGRPNDLGMEQRGRSNNLGMEQRGRPNDLGMEQRGRSNDLGMEHRGRPNDQRPRGNNPPPFGGNNQFGNNRGGNYRW